MGPKVPESWGAKVSHAEVGKIQKNILGPNYENAIINGMNCHFDTQIEACTNEDPRIFGVYDRDGRGV
jgi:hypothetical protein